MKLSTYQKEMADGKHGEAKQKAMHRLMKFGEAVAAEEMISVTSAHILGPDFTMGKLPKYDYGTGPIYKDFAALNARVSVLTTTDPCAMQTDRFSDTGYSAQAVAEHSR